MEREKLKAKLVLPLLVVPFLTLAFWALGGGTGAQAETAKPRTDTGLKVDLPPASLKPELRNKLEYYDQASADSAARAEMMRLDPNLHMQLQERDIFGGLETGESDYHKRNESVQETQVNQRLAALNEVLRAEHKPATQQPPVSPQRTGVDATEVDRLENMMQMMQGGEADPEMAQLSGMLENILDIQHPQRVQQRLQKASAQHKGRVYAVSSQAKKLTPSVLNGDSGQSSGFFSASSPEQGPEAENTIAASVHGTQVLTDKVTVEFRLNRDIYINGQRIPSSEPLHGVVRIEGERMKVDIDQIAYKNSLFNVQLAVHDMDGMEGIHIPGAIARDVAKQSGSNALQGVSMAALDPSLGVQAASAGIELTKSFLGRIVKLIKVTIKEGYRVLLRDKSNK